MCSEDDSQESNYKCHGGCGCQGIIKRESAMQELQNSLFGAVNDSRSTKMTFPDLVKGFLGMFDTTVEAEHQPGLTRLDCYGVR
jgi:hypothetical protein